MDLKRGDSRIIHLAISPASAIPEDATAYFMAKPTPDDDQTDASAAINLTSSGRIIEGDSVKYIFDLLPEHTNSINFEGKTLITLAGEFEIRTTSGQVYSIPEKNRYIKVNVHADIRRGGA